MSLTEEQLAEVRRLWEDTPATAAQIAAQFNTTKNVVVGLAHRRGWTSFTEGTHHKVFETTLERMDRLDAAMDAVLRETEPVLVEFHAALVASRSNRVVVRRAAVAGAPR